MWYFGTNGDTEKMKDRTKMLEKGPASLKKYDPETYQFLDDFFKGKMKVEPLKKPILRSQPTIKSKQVKGGRRFHFVFENRTNSTVILHWLNFKNELSYRWTLPPNISYGCSTFPHHAWVVTDEKGNEIGRYTGTKSSTIILE